MLQLRKLGCKLISFLPLNELNFMLDSATMSFSAIAILLFISQESSLLLVKRAPRDLHS